MKAMGMIGLLLAMGISGYLVMMQLKAGRTAGGVDTSGARGIQAAENAAKKAASTENLEAVRMVVRTFESMNGRWPASLEELRAAGLLESIPEGLDYDPQTGEVKKSP